jgi:hypothetical protein
MHCRYYEYFLYKNQFGKKKRELNLSVTLSVLHGTQTSYILDLVTLTVNCSD